MAFVKVRNLRPTAFRRLTIHEVELGLWTATASTDDIEPYLLTYI